MVHFERILDTLLARGNAVFMTGSEIVDWFISAEALANGSNEIGAAEA
jgi:hypothetical protein